MSQSSAETLLPCPFCGGKAEMWEDQTSDYERDWTWYVGCSDCEAGISVCRTRDHAVRKWNYRVGGRIESVLREALKEIVEFDARCMYERCPDCEYEAECRVVKMCIAAPHGPIGEMAIKALHTTAVD